MALKYAWRIPAAFRAAHFELGRQKLDNQRGSVMAYLRSLGTRHSPIKMLLAQVATTN